jgi:hypothetical protein
MSSSRKVKMSLAVILMLLFVAALGYRIWVTGKISEIVGPSQMAVGSDAIFISYNHEIIELSRSGAIRSRHPLSALGMTSPPIDMLMLGDGRLLLADQSPARLLACNTTTWSCQALAEDIAGKFHAQYKLIIDPADGSLVASDFDSGRLWRFSLENSQISALTAAGLLSQTNDLVMDRNGDIWVADSLNNRIVLLHGDDHDQWHISRSFDADNDYARKGRDWPMMMELDKDGELWVTQPNPTGLGGADLVIYDAEKGARARVDLPEDAHPTDIAVLDDSLLVSDLQRFDLYRIDAHTHAVTRLPDPGFYAVLKEGLQGRQGLASRANLAMIALGIFGVGMILAAIWATPQERRWTRPDPTAVLSASEAAPPETHGTYWLKRNPKTERYLSWALTMSYLAILAILISMGLSLNLVSADITTITKDKLDNIGELKKLFAFMTLLMVGVPVLFKVALRSMKAQLGSDGQRLYIKSADQGQHSFSPEQLVYNDSQILFQDQVVSIKTGHGQPLYAAGEINTYIAPLLKRAKRLGPLEMFRYKLHYREHMLMATLAYTAILVVGSLVTGAWHHMIPGLHSL